MRPSLRFALFLLATTAYAQPQSSQWTFDESEVLDSVGDVKFGQPGPRPPEFPDFFEKNKSVLLGGQGARVVIPDHEDGRFDFGDGDPISLEAWVDLQSANPAEAVYIIGKGRTNSPGFAKDNQNWALRLRVGNGQAQLSFLFASKTGGLQWHRWSSRASFDVGDGWHHVAVSYEFGRPESVAGWIDGVETAGDWDLGGATTKAPVQDDDAVWIGTALGGNPPNSFRGRLDSIAVHRRLLTSKEVESRFVRKGGPRVHLPRPPEMPDPGPIAANSVLVTYGEGLPSAGDWPSTQQQWPKPHARWNTDSYFVPRIPLRFDGMGIRTGWRQGVLMTMAGDVVLPEGEHEILLRVRGLSRLWADGVLIAMSLPPGKDPPNGEERLTPLSEPLFPGARLPGYRQQEIRGSVSVEDSHPVRVVLESIVGGPGLRTESGEVSVAVKVDNEWQLLRPGTKTRIPFDDSSVSAVAGTALRSLAELDDERRRTAAASQNAYWNKRHAEARAAVQRRLLSPPVHDGIKHPIDAFLESKRQRVVNSSGRKQDPFHSKVMPILRKHCLRCHGEKARGGLRLDTRAHALAVLESGQAAIIPGQPDESELLRRVTVESIDERMPPTGSALSDEDVATLRMWISKGATWPGISVSREDATLAPIVSDAVFLRRVWLDTVGVPPPESEVRPIVSGERAVFDRHAVIDTLLKDERCADNQMGEWLDLLAENPALLNKAQGSTGPFRFFLYDSLRDRKPLDRMVTELILMRGGAEEGGSNGFALAAENDSPFAAKAHILSSSFLGIEMQCARCHDAPFHDVSQQDLFSLTAMLQRKAADVPGTSQVPATFFTGRTRPPLIQVTLKSGTSVQPSWPFSEETGVEDSDGINAIMMNPSDSRERVAALMTSPDNRRFAAVMVNRIWKRLMGAGLVEPAHDWEGQSASHPDLLQWLANELVLADYDVRHVYRVIMISQAYQREAQGRNRQNSAERRLFQAPDARRLSAEQIVDSLYASVTAGMEVGELTFVHDGRRALSNRQTLGRPHRAWMMASLNNERDRPSLSLPRAQAVADVMQAFGWNGARQKPVSERNEELSVMQPGVLANGVLAGNLCRATAGSTVADLAVKSATPKELLTALFLRVLSRLPTDAEVRTFVPQLAQGFSTRIIPGPERSAVPKEEPLRRVTWFNHLRPDASRIQQEIERRVRRGPPADPRLVTEWREVYEDVIWALMNHSEFVWIP